MAECLDALEALSLDNHCQNPNLKTIEVEGRQYKFFDLSKVKNFHKLPFCLRIMYESCVRSAWQSSDTDIAQVWSASALQILNRDQGSEILFQPGRVVLQDFTGVAALVWFFYEFELLNWLRLWVLSQAETIITTVFTFDNSIWHFKKMMKSFIGHYPEWKKIHILIAKICQKWKSW